MGKVKTYETPPASEKPPVKRPEKPLPVSSVIGCKHYRAFHDIEANKLWCDECGTELMLSNIAGFIPTKHIKNKRLKMEEGSKPGEYKCFKCGKEAEDCKCWIHSPEGVLSEQPGGKCERDCCGKRHLCQESTFYEGEESDTDSRKKWERPIKGNPYGAKVVPLVASVKKPTEVEGIEILELDSGNNYCNGWSVEKPDKTKNIHILNLRLFVTDDFLKKIKDYELRSGDIVGLKIIRRDLNRKEFEEKCKKRGMKPYKEDSP